jgi:Holliday junction resolvasome RuvABC endonuclease subunit
MVIDRIPLMGIDAAFANTGMALGYWDVKLGRVGIEEIRLVSTEADKANKKVVRKNSDDLRRAREVVEGLRSAIAEHSPRFAFCEVPFGAQSARAAWALGISVGIIANVSVPVIQVTPKEVKEVVAEKFPDKAQMIAWAVKMYPDINWPKHGGKITAGKAEHMADAIAAI